MRTACVKIEVPESLGSPRLLGAAGHSWKPMEGLQVWGEAGGSDTDAADIGRAEGRKPSC